MRAPGFERRNGGVFAGMSTNRHAAEGPDDLSRERRGDRWSVVANRQTPGVPTRGNRSPNRPENLLCSGRISAARTSLTATCPQEVAASAIVTPTFELAFIAVLTRSSAPVRLWLSLPDLPQCF